MPPRSSRSDVDRSARAEERKRPVLEEIIWGRPVFRPPELVNPRVALEPLPFRTQSFGDLRHAGGR
jgi:hypothetical protein